MCVCVCFVLQEAGNAETISTMLSEREDIYIPRNIATLSSARVLTMDWVDGLRLSEVSAALPEQTRSALVEALVSMLLKMFVSDGLFHADLHPGNIVFHTDGSFTLLFAGSEPVEVLLDRAGTMPLPPSPRPAFRFSPGRVRPSRSTGGAPGRPSGSTGAART